MTRDGVVGCIVLFGAAFVPGIVESIDIPNGLFFAGMIAIFAVISACLCWLYKQLKSEERAWIRRD